MSELDREHQLENEVAKLRERFLSQADTIEEFAGRLDRIAVRHAMTYASSSEEAHDVNRICARCRTPFPCDDWKDAEWNSKMTT